MQDADTERVIERFFERQLEDVALDDVSVWQVAGQSERRFDTVTKIDPDNLFRSPLGGELCVPAFAAAAFENDLILEKVLA